MLPFIRYTCMCDTFLFILGDIFGLQLWAKAFHINTVFTFRFSDFWDELKYTFIVLLPLNLGVLKAQILSRGAVPRYALFPTLIKKKKIGFFFSSCFFDLDQND